MDISGFVKSLYLRLMIFEDYVVDGVVRNIVS
jgi:hypothetical protein